MGDSRWNFGSAARVCLIGSAKFVRLTLLVFLTARRDEI
jgi:hypothetical protein